MTSMELVSLMQEVYAFALVGKTFNEGYQS